MHAIIGVLIGKYVIMGQAPTILVSADFERECFVPRATWHVGTWHAEYSMSASAVACGPSNWTSSPCLMDNSQLLVTQGLLANMAGFHVSNYANMCSM